MSTVKFDPTPFLGDGRGGVDIVFVGDTVEVAGGHTFDAETGWHPVKVGDVTYRAMGVPAEVRTAPMFVSARDGQSHAYRTLKGLLHEGDPRLDWSNLTAKKPWPKKPGGGSPHLQTLAFSESLANPNLNEDALHPHILPLFLAAQKLLKGI